MFIPEFDIRAVEEIRRWLLSDMINQILTDKCLPNWISKLNKISRLEYVLCVCEYRIQTWNILWPGR